MNLPNDPFFLFISWVFFALIGAGFVILYNFFMKKTFPKAHDVAIIGFPKSGKTTLITALFGEIFANRITGVEATLRGQRTIERVNSDLAKLELGEALGPTTDQDLFAYRTNITMGSFLRQKFYKAVFGDFPGEMSQKFAEENKEWLHDTIYFKWANEADAFVFVIDLAPYLDNRHSPSKRYVVKMSQAIRAAWQHLLDHNQHRLVQMKEAPLVLLFNKSDLFAITPHPTRDRTKVEQIAQLGLGQNFPTSNQVYQAELEKGQKIVLDDFADLILYLEEQSRKTSVLFVSSVADSNGHRLNLNEFLHAVLPS